jgi:hypothetical protein
VILEQGTREDVDRYRRFTREFVSALDRYYARTEEIGRYQVYRPAAPLQILPADFGGEVALIGWSVGPAPLQTGVLRVTLVWRAMRTINYGFTAFVHLETAGGEKVTQDDHPPHRGFYPTNRWAPGEMVREVYSLDLPPGLRAGRYILRTGWYDPESGDRLPVASSPDASVILGPVDLGEVK